MRYVGWFHNGHDWEIVATFLHMEDALAWCTRYQDRADSAVAVTSADGGYTCGRPIEWPK